MNDACFKAGFGKRPFGSQVVVARPFHDDDRVLNVVLLLSFPNLRDGQLEVDRSVLYRLRFDEQISKVVRHHPLGPMLGRIDAHDRKSVTPHLLDAGPDDSVGLLE